MAALTRRFSLWRETLSNGGGGGDIASLGWLGQERGPTSHMPLVEMSRIGSKFARGAQLIRRALWNQPAFLTPMNMEASAHGGFDQVMHALACIAS